ncbi:chitin synthase chs-1-like [Trichomycterus rosablanca]|uniref:chitin synthase chs-1-like n=1 Tax=Trichomycterus rosablanca TaxID=2290929 RepID=UPI002F351C18
MDAKREEKQCRFNSTEWDTCREVPIIQEESHKKRHQFFKHLCHLTVGVLVFSLAVLSKSSFLVLVTLNSNVTTSVPVEYKATVSLSIGCVLVAPNILLLMKSLWKFIFKNVTKPSWKTILCVVFVQSFVSLGEALLTVMAMPYFDIVTNVMILNSVSIMSAVFQMFARFYAKEMKYVVAAIFSIVFTVLGYIFFIVSYRTMVGPLSMAIVGTILVSVNWWENYKTLFKCMEKFFEEKDSSQNVLSILSSLVKVLVTAVVVGISVPFWHEQEWIKLTSIPKNIQIAVFGLMAIQIASSIMCRWLAVVACKMHALRCCFVMPMYLTSVSSLVLCLVLMKTFPTNSSTSIAHSLLADVTNTWATLSKKKMETLVIIGICALSWWLGLILSTFYTWFRKIKRIERTQDLFLGQMYEGAFLEQSLLLNTRFETNEKNEENRTKKPVTVYLCATMWHETDDEMMKIIISMFRLDKFRPKENFHKDASFECHIFFDDAFEDVNGGEGRHLNEYAKSLVKVIKEVKTFFITDNPSSWNNETTDPGQAIISTPYGGRLVCKLPNGNLLMVHYKDKQLIRHKKRWSQIMYMYYLLNWRLNSKYPKGEEQEKQLKVTTAQAENTYILALDGDTDFLPSAVMLLIDRLRLYPGVGAACGRIHPTGTGPMVWYQKFEYAVGHWLQKTAEHVFGCVLCSPGCFSLFRGSALMDNNVMRTYTKKATEASHHVQYDQGEDRWLCTLLLQQGYRVEYNAASDAYTNAPQDFKEFYNQRRRWGPSTMANTIDLLSSGNLTSERNGSISKPYIIYQVISMGTSILGPATICLMIAGSFTFLFQIKANLALILAIVPPAIYLALCFKLKADTQLQIAAVMSIFYAFIMTGTILCIIGEMVKNGTFVTPSGLFLISMVAMYLITAILHPQEFPLIIYGVLYCLCIPSGYLLLTIYSIVNMNNVSWGTRETGGKAKTVTVNTIRRQLIQAVCGKCPFLKNTLSETEPPVESLVSKQQDPEVMESQETDRSDVYLSTETPKSWIEDLQIQHSDLPLINETLSKTEIDFWKDLLRKYLEPIKENKEQQEQVVKELKELRNKVSFVFFIFNTLWLVATFFLQAIGNNITLPIPKVNPDFTISNEKLQVDPISLMFLLSFALLIFVQFFAMLYHRIYTLIHFVAYMDTEIKAGQKQQTETSNETAAESA